MSHKDLVFKSVSIRNFLSYGNNTTVFDLSERGTTTLIVGRDLDARAVGTGANGVGKTVLLNALSFGIYDKPVSDISKDKLVNNINQSNMVVSVNFSKNGKEYRVERYRKMKASKNNKSGTYVVLYENEVDITPDSIANTNALLEKIIGIPHDMFVTVVVFAANQPSFMHLPLKQQVEMVERLFGFVELTEKAEKLKDQIRENKQCLALEQQAVEHKEQEVQRYQQQLKTVTERAELWENEQREAIKRLEMDIQDVATVDFSSQEALLTEYQANIDTIQEHKIRYNEVVTILKKADEWKDLHQRELKQLNDDRDIINELAQIDFERQLALLTEHDEKVTLCSELNNSITTTTNTLKTIERDLEELTNEHTHLNDANCPYCKQRFEDVGDKLLEVEKNLTIKQQLLIEHKDALNALNVQLAETNKAVDDLKLNLIVKSKTQIVEMKNELKTLKTHVNTVLDKQNPHVADDGEYDQLNNIRVKAKGIVEDLTLKNEKIKSALLVESFRELDALKSNRDILMDRLENERVKVNPHTDTLKELNAMASGTVDYTLLNNLKKKIEHAEFLKKLLTQRDSFIRKALLSNHLPYLNGRLQHYLQELGLNFKIEFTHELTTNISKMGRPYDFGNLSNGQKSRVNIALSMAFRDVLQKIHCKVNVCILDEALDVGLDSIGVQAAARMLKRHAKDENMSMFVISHRDEINNTFEKTLTIEMEKGFSYISDQRFKGDIDD